MPTLSNVVLEGRDRKDRCTQSVNSPQKKWDYRKVAQARASVERNAARTGVSGGGGPFFPCVSATHHLA